MALDFIAIDFEKTAITNNYRLTRDLREMKKLIQSSSSSLLGRFSISALNSQLAQSCGFSQILHSPIFT